MGRRRRRTPRDHDDDDVDMTSYDDVTRSSALLAYIQMSAADCQLGVSVVGYLGHTAGPGGGLFISGIHDNGAVMRDGRLQLGDKLNSINGFRVGHLGNHDAFRLLTATVQKQLGSDHTVRLGIVRSRDVSVLRHWQRWSRDDNTMTSLALSAGCTTRTTITTTTTISTSSSRPTAVVQGSISATSGVYFTTTRF